MSSVFYRIIELHLGNEHIVLCRCSSEVCPPGLDVSGKIAKKKLNEIDLQHQNTSKSCCSFITNEKLKYELNNERLFFAYFFLKAF